MTNGHLQADCLYTGISSGPNARCRVWEAFTFTFFPSILTVKYSIQDICIALHNVCDISPLKFSDWHVLTRHQTVPPTPLSTYGMSHLVFYSPPQPQSITARWPVLISRPAQGRRLSWLGWLGEILRWFARPKTVTHRGRPANRARR